MLVLPKFLTLGFGVLSIF